MHCFGVVDEVLEILLSKTSPHVAKRKERAVSVILSPLLKYDEVSKSGGATEEEERERGVKLAGACGARLERRAVLLRTDKTMANNGSDAGRKQQEAWPLTWPGAAVLNPPMPWATAIMRFRRSMSFGLLVVASFEECDEKW